LKKINLGKFIELLNKLKYFSICILALNIKNGLLKKNRTINFPADLHAERFSGEFPMAFSAELSVDLSQKVCCGFIFIFSKRFRVKVL
jgi:hypothetical protein